MIVALEVEFNRLCNLLSQDELRRNPRAKKKMLQMRQTLIQLARLFNFKTKAFPAVSSVAQVSKKPSNQE